MKMRTLTICFLLVALLLASCTQKAVPTTVSAADYYADNGISSWLDAASVWMTNSADNSSFIYNNKSGTTPESVLFNVFSNRDVESEQTDLLKSALEQSPEKLTTEEMALYAYALKAAKVDYDAAAAVAELESRQQSDGGFGLGHDYAVSEPTPSSYALDLVMLWRDKVSDNCYDSVLIYFYNNMTDNNAWEDEDGKESCSLTCRVLMGFIHAGIRYDGDDAKAILNSVNTLFGVKASDNTIKAYKEYADDTVTSKQASSYALLANTVASMGDLWSVFDVRGGVN